MPAFGRGIHPPFSFCRCKKRTGRGRSKRKNASRWGSEPDSRQVPARAVVQAGVWRFQTPVSSCSAAAAPALPGSGSEKRRPGHPRSPIPAQSTPRDSSFQTFSGHPHREAFFSFGPCTARFLFGKSEKKMGGAFPAPKRRNLTDSFDRSSTVHPSAGAYHRRWGCGSNGRSPGRFRRWPPR